MAPAFITCVFFSCVFLCRWNAVSLQGSFPKPSLRITSGSVTVRRGNLTLKCTGSRTDVTFALYGGPGSIPPQDPPGTEAVFHFTDVNAWHEGSYDCLYYSKGTSRIISPRSDRVEVTLRDSYPKPSVTLSPGSVVRGGGNLAIHCTTEYPNMRFVLYRKEISHAQKEAPGDQGVFVITGVQPTDEGSYHCRYHPISGPHVWSDASDDFQIRVLDNQQETNAATTSGNNQQETNTTTTSGGLETPIIIAIVCAVLLVVILVVAFILYIKCKPKKGKGDIQKRNLPLNEEKKAEALEPMYASVTIVNASNNTVALEVKKQEEGGDDEGLTYAVINKDALKNKKNSAPTFQEPEPTLYAAVNVH